MIRKNYQSDLEFLLQIKPCSAEVLSAVGADNADVTFPDYDFTGVLTTSGRPGQRFVFSRVGDRFTNCFRDGNALHVVLNNHGLEPGQMALQWNARIPNDSFEDGFEDIAPKFKLPIELVRGAGDCDCTPDVIDVIMPYAIVTAYDMAVANGYGGTIEQYTAALQDLPMAVINAESAAKNANDTADRLANLFSEFSDGKRNIAAAITEQGVPTPDDITFNEMADNIRQLYLPQDSDFWKGLGYETEEDFSGGLGSTIEAIKEMQDMWDQSEFYRNPNSWVELYEYGKKSFIICPKIDTSNVTTMQQMFYDCSSLVSIPELDTSKVTNMSDMFTNCSSLLSIPEFDTSNVTTMNFMFKNCSSLLSIPEFDTSKVLSTANMLYGCYSLHELKMYGLKVGINISWSPLLENDSILFIIENAAPTQNITITLHVDAYNRAIADEDIQAALAAQPLVTLAHP